MAGSYKVVEESSINYKITAERKQKSHWIAGL